jgi:integrase
LPGNLVSACLVTIALPVVHSLVHSGWPVPKVNNAYDRAVRDSKGALFRLYSLRHTGATCATMSGIELVTLAVMLGGHSRIQMVLRYAHLTQEHQQGAMARLERFE